MKVLLLVVLVATVAWAKPASKPAPRKGFYKPGPRIVNGQNAQEGEFPHQISYQWGIFGFFEHVCGGTIISPTWVLTAAHCVTEVPAFGDFKIVAGITDLYVNTPETQNVNVIEKIVHPNYAGSVGPNDIALLRLQTSLRFGNLVKAINLPAPGAEPSGTSVLSGWGATDIIFDIPILPEILQTVNLPILSFAECNGAILPLLEQGEENPLSEASNVCTGPLTGGISACSGDSGGPLIQGDTIIGVVSWGFIPCGAVGAPSVYTKVSNFIDFITLHVTDLP